MSIVSPEHIKPPSQSPFQTKGQKSAEIRNMGASKLFWKS